MPNSDLLGYKMSHAVTEQWNRSAKIVSETPASKVGLRECRKARTMECRKTAFRRQCHRRSSRRPSGLAGRTYVFGHSWQSSQRARRQWPNGSFGAKLKSFRLSALPSQPVTTTTYSRTNFKVRTASRVDDAIAIATVLRGRNQDLSTMYQRDDASKPV